MCLYTTLLTLSLLNPLTCSQDLFLSLTATDKWCPNRDLSTWAVERDPGNISRTDIYRVSWIVLGDILDVAFLSVLFSSGVKMGQTGSKEQQLFVQLLYVIHSGR